MLLLHLLFNLFHTQHYIIVLRFLLARQVHGQKCLYRNDCGNCGNNRAC